MILQGWLDMMNYDIRLMFFFLSNYFDERAEALCGDGIEKYARL